MSELHHAHNNNPSHPRLHHPFTAAVDQLRHDIERLIRMREDVLRSSFSTDSNPNNTPAIPLRDPHPLTPATTATATPATEIGSVTETEVSILSADEFEEEWNTWIDQYDQMRQMFARICNICVGSSPSATVAEQSELAQIRQQSEVTESRSNVDDVVDFVDFVPFGSRESQEDDAEAAAGEDPLEVETEDEDDEDNSPDSARWNGLAFILDNDIMYLSSSPVSSPRIRALHPRSDTSGSDADDADASPLLQPLQGDLIDLEGHGFEAERFGYSRVRTETPEPFETGEKNEAGTSKSQFATLADILAAEEALIAAIISVDSSPSSAQATLGRTLTPPPATEPVVVAELSIDSERDGNGHNDEMSSSASEADEAPQSELFSDDSSKEPRRTSSANEDWVDVNDHKSVHSGSDGIASAPASPQLVHEESQPEIFAQLEELAVLGLPNGATAIHLLHRNQGNLEKTVVGLLCLQRLKDKGFTDENKCLGALEQSNFDVTKAVAILSRGL
jgi:hypothetical protein